jgi:hypothetical protein
MSLDSEAASIEAIVRSRLSSIQDASTTVVSACAAWIGVYSSVAPAVITRVWASLLTDAANTDSDQRVGLLAVMHESLKNCARRGGSEDVIRKYVLAARRDVPNAITTAIEIESSSSSSTTSNTSSNEFKKSALQALMMWRNFSGFFPSQWLEKTISTLSTSLNANNNNNNNSTSANGEDSALLTSNNNNNNNSSSSTATTNQGSNNNTISLTAATAGIDSIAAEASGLSEILKLFQKYNNALEKLRRYEADPSTSASALESARDDVIHRAKPLLSKLGSSGGVAGFIPNIEGEVKRVTVQQQQQQQTSLPEDTADPLEDFF